MSILLADSMDQVALRRTLVGTWLLPAGRAHQSTLTLSNDGTMRMIVASASTYERMRQIAGGDQVVGTWRLDSKLRVASMAGSATSSVTSSGSSFRPPLVRSQLGDKGPEKGPFLVLNVTDLPKAIGNMKLFGLRVDIANWIIGLDAVRGSYFFKIIALRNEASRVEVADARGVKQTWDRVS